MALNPHQKNKVDLSQLTEEEQKLFRLYGKLPNKKDLLQKKLQERKYFDSGDYAMSKAGKSDAGIVGGLGREHPSPETIPHLSPQQQQQGNAAPNPGLATGGPTLHPTHSHGPSTSPVKEPSFLHRGTSVDEEDPEAIAKEVAKAAGGDGEVGEVKGMPIRQ